jgi:flagellar hook-length control protein FliK
MMSAKTVVTEAPACPAPAAAGIAASAATPGSAPSDFQNVLAGAVAPLLDAPGKGTPPLQPLIQLLNLKNQQQAAKLAVAAGTPGAQPAAVANPAAVSPADLLQVLTDDTVTPRPDAGVATAAGEAAPEQLPAEDVTKSDDDILSDWFEFMLPPSVLAPQAGSANNSDAGTASQDGDATAGARQSVPLGMLPPSLVLQAGQPDSGGGADGSLAATLAVNREASAAAVQSTASAFVATLAGKTEPAERDAPADNWMSALGDLTAKRAPEAAAIVEGRLPTPVHDARWADALAHRLVMMARDGESVASLKLVPVDLGPLDIQISVRDGQASVHFGAAHPETRAVLEASMPRLRELLGAQGLQLANASVSHQSAGQNRPERSSGPTAVGAVTDEPEAASAKVISTSLLDLYA